MAEGGQWGFGRERGWGAESATTTSELQRGMNLGGQRGRLAAAKVAVSGDGDGDGEDATRAAVQQSFPVDCGQPVGQREEDLWWA